MTGKEKSIGYVDQFVSEFKKNYPSVSIGYDYDNELDYYDIWHNSYDLQFKNEDFLKIVGGLIKNIFYANGIFNVSFGYDCSKENEGTCFYETMGNYYMLNIALSDLSFKYSDSLKYFSYTTKVSSYNNTIKNICIDTEIHHDAYTDTKFNYKHESESAENRWTTFERQWSVFKDSGNIQEEGLAA